MASNTRAKIDRELYGPSLLEVTLGALLSVLLGVLIAGGYLLLKPVETVRELPPPEDRPRGQVYYIEGSRSTANARQWMRKRQLLAEGRPAEVELIEDEINAWLADGPKPSPDDSRGLLHAESVNVRIRDGVMQIASPGSLNAFGYTKPILLQARGEFERDGDRHVFVPSELYVGSLALHEIPLVRNYVVRQLIGGPAMPDEVVNAWSELDEVSVDGNALRLVQR